MKRVPWIISALCLFSSLTLATEPKHRTLSAVPFTAVKFEDAFWTPRLVTNREVSLPHNFEWCERTGRIDNFAKAGKLMPGKFEGLCFNDSDVFKVLEGASYSLAAHADSALDKTVDGVVRKIAAAQQPDGYLNTYFTLAEPGKRWTRLASHHELYCAGHMIEAAVAHYRATGKRTFLDIAIKYADCIDNTFGPTKLHGLCGHEEIELALVKLFEVTGQEKYLNLANFFIDMRGNKAARDGRLWGSYCQDHEPIAQQSEIAGHAVRAMYLYTGVADVAAYTGNQKLIDAMARLWQDMTIQKIYITGGIGARHKGEAFGEAYELPNDSAYCETCAAIGVAIWAHRLNLMHGDAQYADVLEQAAYNGILSGVGMDGKHFFYVNPLASDGKHHRQPFFACACCPSNVVRFIPSLPGYVYAVGDDGIVVNLYVAGEAKIVRGDGTVTLTQETDYPWDGRVKLTVRPQKPDEFTIALRIPGWCRGAKLAINGTPVDSTKITNGYARLQRRWQAGDTVALDLPMPVERIEANPHVQADLGRVAIRRGPIVYCLEAVDNGGSLRNVALARDPQFSTEHRKDLLGGVTVIKGLASDGRRLTAMPYYAWDHRAAGEMAVWLMQDGKSLKSNANDPAWKGKLYRPIDPASSAP
ncbi:MAG: glycoside hydrolase family 127 protein [Planctomycetaceae bacterium]|nr:glycoside hydrolase family 127 protein [Planctomycetaceae bacterium]